MYKFGNVKVSGFFVVGGYRYRKVLHAKCWDHDVENIRFYNAVAVERAGSPVMRLFEDDDTVESISRFDLVAPIPLETIFDHQRNHLQWFKKMDPEDESWEHLQGVASTLDEVLEEAQAGNWEEAYKKVRSLDTYDRNWITEEMYDEICERMESDK